MVLYVDLISMKSM